MRPLCHGPHILTTDSALTPLKVYTGQSWTEYYHNVSFINQASMLNVKYDVLVASHRFKRLQKFLAHLGFPVDWLINGEVTSGWLMVDVKRSRCRCSFVKLFKMFSQTPRSFTLCRLARAASRDMWYFGLRTAHRHFGGMCWLLVVYTSLWKAICFLVFNPKPPLRTRTKCGVCQWWRWGCDKAAAW